MSKELLAQKAAQLTEAQSKTPVKIVAKNTFSSHQNPLEDSTIISFNGHWTFVPKGAVLHLPEQFSSRIVTKPEGKLISFPEFIRSNFAWLKVQELTKSQLQGKGLDSEEFKEKLKTSNSVTISTRNKFPVSIHNG